MRINERLLAACLAFAVMTAPLAVASDGPAAGQPRATIAKPAPAAAAAPLCSATADCCDDSWVTCSGGGTCVAVDAACPAQRGYVQCNGVTTYCPACTAPACQPPPCSTTTCAKDSQCYDWCMQHEGYPGVCRNGCCICA